MSDFDYSKPVRLPEQATVTVAVERPLSWGERIFGKSWVRKCLILLVLALAWEGYARWVNNAFMLPTFLATLQAMVDGILSGELFIRVFASLKTLMVGYGIGVVLAILLTLAAAVSRFGSDLLETLTSMFNPLPAIAILPIAMIWFGLGSASVVFVVVHSVLWAVALNTHSGFTGVSRTLRMVGRNYGLGGLSYVSRILIPAAFPSILTGLKIGWAFAWRTLIAAELVFGVSSGAGGLGWFIYENKNLLYIDKVFAGLLMVILIGLAIENLIFASIERRTIRRWGMQVGH